MSESKGYTRSEVTSMQQDAIRRVREMQRRAIDVTLIKRYRFIWR